MDAEFTFPFLHFRCFILLLFEFFAKCNVFSGLVPVLIMHLIEFFDVIVAFLLKISQKLSHAVLIVLVVLQVYLLVQHMEIL